MGQYQRINYPDGQVSAKWIPDSKVDEPFTKISERINSYADLFYVRAIADIINNVSFPKSTKLFIPCMFGQRSDRRFDTFQSFDLKLITDVINECNFDEVEVFDPHSDVTMALINKSVKKSSFEFVHQAMQDIFTENDVLGVDAPTDLLLVSPDAGAYKKVFEYGEKLGLPVMGAMKHRDKDGKISLIFTHDVEGKDCLIVDDLCDGGYTFILLAKALREQKARKVYLYVSHGIFSKGFIELTSLIDHIYCTNSVKDLDLTNRGTHGGMELSNFVTQYKVI